MTRSILEAKKGKRKGRSVVDLSRKREERMRRKGGEKIIGLDLVASSLSSFEKILRDIFSSEHEDEEQEISSKHLVSNERREKGRILVGEGFSRFVSKRCVSHPRDVISSRSWTCSSALSLSLSLSSPRR